MGKSLPPKTTEIWDHVYKDSKHLLMNLIGIEVPIAAALTVPTEIPVLSNVVIAA
jgi:hypothetical protein